MTTPITPADRATEADIQLASESIGYTNKQEAKIVAWAKSNFQSIKQMRSPVERQWYLNMAFYRGRQNVAYRKTTTLVNGGSGQLYTPPAPYWRSRPVINRIKPIIRGELAKLTSQKPTAYILPATSDDRDMFAAQAGEQLWESIYRFKKIPAVMRKALWWNQVCGNGFIKVAWDPDLVDKNSNQKGDLCYSAETPFHIFCPDFRATDLEDQPFLIHAQLKTPDWVKLNYPEANFKQSGDKQNEILDDSWLDILGQQMSRNRESILSLECWVKPKRLANFPNGAMFTIVGDSLVQFKTGWPYQHGNFPFVKLDNIPTGKFYTDSNINDLISPQREYNRTRGQIIENKNRMAKLQLLAEKGSIDAAKITTEPGQVIEYQPGFNPPTAMPLQALPAYVTQELDRILLDMNDISGQHEVSKGQTPPGVTAATAINFLQEQDDTMLSFTFASLEESYEAIGFMTLSYIQQFWDTPRIIKIVGQDGFFDSMTFKGSSLRGNTDIRVEAGSALPISKAAKQAFIMDLMKMQFIDPATGLEVMEMGGIAKIYEAVQVDVRQAQRENLKMSQITAQAMQMMQMQQMQADPMAAQMPPTVVEVNSWDNHDIHIATHNKYRKSQAFEALDDAAKSQFEQHVQMHVAATMSGQTGINSIEMLKQQAAMQQDPNAQGGNAGQPGAAMNAGGNQFSMPQSAGGPQNPGGA
jgi:hypothetical protein